jgi:hypothetical protein
MPKQMKHTDIKDKKFFLYSTEQIIRYFIKNRQLDKMNKFLLNKLEEYK